MAATPSPSSPPAAPGVQGPQAGSASEVFRVFLVLGLTSFGGPVAHLAYFREAFVVRRRWLADEAYAELVALCQFLPGPASSQVGMAIGLGRAGYRGMAAAWVAFTLPSVLLLVAFAYGATAVGDAGDGAIAGLAAGAVGVVAHAVVGMARSLAPDLPRLALAGAAAAIAVLLGGAAGQLLAIALGAFVGLAALGAVVPASAGVDSVLRVPVSRRGAFVALGLFVAVLTLLPLAATLTRSGAVELLDGFARAGAFVFGGGHVVLPLLDAQTVALGDLTRDAFVAGYGAAQAVPGPLFSFAAYLGAAREAAPNGPLGALLATIAIFLPSALLIVAALPFWARVRGDARAQRLMAGVGAAVVGILAAALWDPVAVEGIRSVTTGVLAVAAFAALTSGRVPAWAVVIAAGLLGFAAG